MCSARMKRPSLASLMMLAAASLFGGCGGGGGDEGGADGGGTPGFTVELEMRATNGATRSTFAFGDTIVFALSITNRSGAAQVLNLPTSQLYDLAVLPEGSQTPIWRWSFTQVFTPGTTSLSFAGHQTITHLYLWNGVLDDGTQIVAGRYDACGTLAYAQYASDWRGSHALAASPRRLTITD